MNVYVTKYCLSGRGTIALRSAKATHTPTMVTTQWREGEYGGSELYLHKPDWHETKEAALLHAETMRQKKIASLRKQIQKLEQMKFVIEE